MILTIDELIQGNPKIVEFYQKALRLWEKLLSKQGELGGRDPDVLAKMLTDEQFEFEMELGLNRRLAQEILAVAGIARLSAEDGGGAFHGHEGDIQLVRL